MPNVEALLDGPRVQSIQFESAAGPLSESKSAALLAALKRKAGDTDILDKHIAVESALVGDLAASEAVELARWERRPLSLRVREWASRLWERLL